MVIQKKTVFPEKIMLNMKGNGLWVQTLEMAEEFRFGQMAPDTKDIGKLTEQMGGEG